MKFSPCLAFLLFAVFSSAQAQQSGMVAGNIKILELSGAPADVLKADGTSSSAKAGDFILEGSTIKTAAGSSVTLLLDNGALVTIKPETEFSIDKFVTDPFGYEGVDYRTIKTEPSRSVTKLNVKSGEILLDVVPLNRASQFDIATPVGSAGIRGTRLGVRCSNGNANVVVAIGSVVVTSLNGQMQTLTASMGISVASNGLSPMPQPVITAIIQAITNFVQQFRPTLPAGPFAGAPAQGSTTTGSGDETSDTGDQATINAGQALPGSGNRPSPVSN